MFSQFFMETCMIWGYQVSSLELPGFLPRETIATILQLCSLSPNEKTIGPTSIRWRATITKL